MLSAQRQNDLTVYQNGLQLNPFAMELSVFVRASCSDTVSWLHCYYMRITIYPIQVKVIGQGQKLFLSATRNSVWNTYTKFRCNPSSSFSETVHESWRNNNNKKRG